MNASVSSQYSSKYLANYCIDGNETGAICYTQSETAPWLALDYGSEVKVSRVVLINYKWGAVLAALTKNVNIRVSSTPPVSGSEMFTGGQLLGTFEGPGEVGQRIEVTSDTELTGRYVVVQNDHISKADKLILQEVTAWGQGRIFQ